MKGHKQVVDALNATLTAQLTAINQLFLAAKVHEHRGFLRLARAAYKQSIHVMRRAEPVIARVLLLEGLPNLQRIAKVGAAEGPVEQLSLDLTLQQELCARLEELARTALSLADHGTAELAEDQLSKEQVYLHWLEAQQRELAQLGHDLYLAAQIHDAP
jgi:bacterioferritin